MSIWFTEEEGQGLKISYKVKEILYQGQSKFQKIAVIDTEDYGRTLLLDDLVMCTENDEFVYHEMITHVPVLLHGNVAKALVIGGGDGGTVRELLKHPIEQVVLCEIDQQVVDIAKEYLPSMSSGLSQDRVTISYESGFDLLRGLPNDSFDLIIVDSTDPVGPGAELFSVEFYREVCRVVGGHGLMVCQSESPWYDQQILQSIHANMSESFQNVVPYLAAIPTYPRGFWSFSIGANRDIPLESSCYQQVDSLENLQYLNQDVFAASFALPQFYKAKLNLT